MNEDLETTFGELLKLIKSGVAKSWEVQDRSDSYEAAQRDYADAVVTDWYSVGNSYHREAKYEFHEVFSEHLEQGLDTIQIRECTVYDKRGNSHEESEHVDIYLENIKFFYWTE